MRWVHIKRNFGICVLLKFQYKKKNYSFLAQLSTTSKKYFVATLGEKVKPVVMEKCEFERRELLIISPLWQSLIISLPT